MYVRVCVCTYILCATEKLLHYDPLMFYVSYFFITVQMCILSVFLKPIQIYLVL